MEFEVTLRMPEAVIGGYADLPRCRDASLEHGRSGFVTASFVKDGDDQAFALQCALTDLRYVLPDAVVTRIEFRS